MPASEATWRNQRWLHIVFGVSSLLMLIMTVWMFAADHGREWKRYQVNTNRVEQFYTQGQIDEIQTATFALELEKKKAGLLEARSAGIDPSLVEQFKGAVKRDAGQRNEFYYEQEPNRTMPEDPEQREIQPYDFSELDELLPTLAPLVEAVEEARQEEEAVRTEAERKITEARQALAEVDVDRQTLRDEIRAAQQEIAAAEAKTRAAQDEAAEQRRKIVGILRDVVDRAQLRENELLRKRKFKTADRTAAVSELGLAQEKGDLEAAAELQNKIDQIEVELKRLTERYEWANLHRKRLEEILRGDDGINAVVLAAEKELDAAQTELRRLHEQMKTAWDEQVGKVVFTAPILDAFNNTDLKVDQVWLPDLTIDFNFSHVARFDRCITCHEAIDKTQPGTAVRPEYETQGEPFDVLLTTPEGPLPPEVSPDPAFAGGAPDDVMLRRMYGLKIAEQGVLDPDDVLVQVVWPTGLSETISARGAEAGLRVGDQILQINGRQVVDRRDAVSQLVHSVDWGRPIRLTVQRGLPHPYASHPRLDLYVGSLSPHKKEDVGCTVCHDGQGSATAFKWASHTPNTPEQALDWSREHGWFDNHHWIFPMYPKRFVESGCLKCHHEVTGLLPSERFPEPPAEKLVSGYRLVEQYGCFGCHEINGYDGPDRRVGPDLRAAPNYYAFAANLLLEIEPRLSEARSLLERMRELEDPYRSEFDRLQADIKKLQDQKSALLQEAAKKPDAAAQIAEQTKPLDEQISELRAEAARVEVPLNFAAARRMAVQRRVEALEEMQRHSRRLIQAPEDDDARRQLIKLVEIDAEKELQWSGVQPRIDQLTSTWEEQREAIGEPSARIDELQQQVEELEAQKESLEAERKKAEAEEKKQAGEKTAGEKTTGEKTPGEKSPAEKELAEIDEQLAALGEELSAVREEEDKHEALMEAAQRDMEALTFSILPAVAEGLAGDFKDVETPGTYRKVGPSLRHVASKSDFEFLYSWIRKPSDFRPSTRMPQFFGLWDHLEGEGLETAEKFEPLEIRGITEYLLSASQPFEYRPRRETAEGNELAEPSAERGKFLFQTRGCLACHAHREFPGIESDHGPDLSRIGSKLEGEEGRRWLYTWLVNPNRYHPRTKMPNLILDPMQYYDAGWIDPAADIVEYLLTSGEPWEAEGAPPRESLTDAEREALGELALSHLEKAYPSLRAKRYLQEGITDVDPEAIKGDEIVLHGEIKSGEERVRRQLLYVGRRAISKYGCFGCHDIPGYERAKPIGTGLADWGRKETSKLAFEHIGAFLGLHGHGAETGHGDGHHAETEDAQPRHGLTSADRRDPDVAYFLEAVAAHNRQGFLWQKLRMPRSYDYKKTKNKGYNERLRMPQFPLTAEQREAVMTFVLGLVSEPPAAKYIYTPDPRQDAMIAGRHVMEKYNCAGCHMVTLDRWEVDFLPDDERFQPVSSDPDYPFLATHFTPEQIQESLEFDRRGRRHAVLYGRPMLSQETGGPMQFDSEGDPVEPEYADEVEEKFEYFELWEPALVNGSVRHVGSPPLFLGEQNVTKYPGWGGDLANYLFPVVLADEKQRNPKNFGAEGLGWLPPPLHVQGRKTQTQWMHDFLLDPYPIRPAVVLRMPEFNLSSDEATQIANYFAARDNAQYPYPYDPELGESRMADTSLSDMNHGQNPVKIVISKCVQCHKLGDFTPKGSDKGLAPNLDQVYRRLRPDFLKDWIANPKRVLPYTGMPVNIPYKTEAPFYGGVEQSVYHGTSFEQLAGLVDFLMNYDLYTKNQVTFVPAIEEMQKRQQQSAAVPSGANVAGGE